MGFHGKYLLEVKRPDLYFYEQNSLFFNFKLLLSFISITASTPFPRLISTTHTTTLSQVVIEVIKEKWIHFSSLSRGS